MTATIVADCPRCGAKRMTLDVVADIHVGSSHGWMSHHEVGAVCRLCHNMSIAKLDLMKSEHKHDFLTDGALVGIKGDLTPTFRVRGFLDVSDLKGVQEPPEHVPDEIESAFREGAKCMAIGCYNAAGAMFRLCLDLTTKPLLPDPNDKSRPQPTNAQRFKLGPRVDWLIEQNIVPRALSDLAHCIRQDGNDGAHDGSLREADAADLIDFASALLERQFTEPERLRLAKERQTARRMRGFGDAEPAGGGA